MEWNRSAGGTWTNIAVIGPAQTGKSTVCGFLLWALNQVDLKTFDDALQAAGRKKDVTRTFAYILDRMPSERATTPERARGRGISQSTTYRGFRSRKGRVMLMVSPGHYQKVSHIIGALSEADGVLLVVDAYAYLEELERGAREVTGPGVMAQIRGHLATARYFGIKQLAVAIHQMDRLDFSEESFRRVEKHLCGVLVGLRWEKYENVAFIPTAIEFEARTGHNILRRSDGTRWYRGSNLLDALTGMQPRLLPVNETFRMQVNRTYHGQIRGYELVITGQVLTGKIQVKDELLVQPSGYRCRVRTIQSIDNARAAGRQSRWEPQSQATAGEVVGLGCTIRELGTDEIEPGEIAGAPLSPPTVARHFWARLLVLHVPQMANILNGRFVSGAFGQGFFRTGFQVKQFSFDEGATWVPVPERTKPPKEGGRAAKEPDESEKVALPGDRYLTEGQTFLADIVLERPAPLDIHVSGTDLGQFILEDTNRFLLCGGQIVKVIEEP